MNILYIILKHVIWRFQIYNLFREIFKFREDKSNNVFREIRKCFHKTAKFEFFISLSRRASPYMSSKPKMEESIVKESSVFGRKVRQSS